MTLYDGMSRIKELRDIIRLYEKVLNNPGIFRDDELLKRLIKRHKDEIERLEENIHLNELDDMGVKDE